MLSVYHASLQLTILEQSIYNIKSTMRETIFIVSLMQNISMINFTKVPHDESEH